MNQITPKVSTRFEPGAILSDSWGCEQTNVDFYVIMRRTGQFITVLPMFCRSEYDSKSMTSKNIPGEVDYTAKLIRKKLKSYDGQESGFSFSNYSGGGWCRLWKGCVQHASHYA